MNSFGHYGYTGSMAWADPDEEIILYSFQTEPFQLGKYFASKK